MFKKGKARCLVRGGQRTQKKTSRTTRSDLWLRGGFEKAKESKEGEKKGGAH